MNFIKAEIPGVIFIEPETYEDPRGLFFSSYQRDLFQKNGVVEDFIQDNHSVSRKGVLRGLHYQCAPHEQAKLLRVVRGSVYDVIVDVREGSPTFGRWMAGILSDVNRKMIYVPKGFAHGFLALEDHTEFSYKISSAYSPGHERGILWSDPGLGIPWPALDGKYLMSDKDKALPTLRQSRGTPSS